MLSVYLLFNCLIVYLGEEVNVCSHFHYQKVHHFFSINIFFGGTTDSFIPMVSKRLAISDA